MSSSSSSSADSPANKKMILLKSAEGDVFEVQESVAVQSGTIRQLIEDHCANNVIPLPNVTSKILAKILEYCNRHGATPRDDDALKAFDEEFMKVDDQGTLFDLMLGANYLEIESLLDLTFQTAAAMIKGKTVEEIRKTFNIKNDFTPEEEAEVRRENDWAF